VSRSALEYLALSPGELAILTAATSLIGHIMQLEVVGLVATEPGEPLSILPMPGYGGDLIVALSKCDWDAMRRVGEETVG
jgi:hypothetical protein